MPTASAAQSGSGHPQHQRGSRPAASAPPPGPEHPGNERQAETCSLCGAPILAAEIAGGAAVRVGKELICPNCVEQLPTGAKVRINQLRALHGMQATTYRVVRSRHPALRCHTFSTAGQVLHHRRLRNHGKDLDAPIIGSRSEVLTSAARQASASASRYPRWLLVAGGALLLLAGLAGLLPTQGDPSTAAIDPPIVKTESPSLPTPPLIARRRSDYPTEPVLAFPRAAAELSPGDPLLAEIAADLTTQRDAQLALVRQALAAQELLRAEDLLGRMRLADHPLLASTTRQERALADELARQKEVARLTEDARLQEEERLRAAQAASATTVTPPSALSQPQAQPRWLFPISAFAAAPPPGWTATDGAWRLDGDSGSLSRALRLPAGSWQLWLHVRGEVPAAGTLSASLGGATLTPSRTPEPGVKGGWQWLGLDAQAAVTADGESLLTITAQGSGWTLVRVVVTEAGAPMPGKGKELDGLLAPDWLALPAPPAEDDPEANTIAATIRHLDPAPTQAKRITPNDLQLDAGFAAPARSVPGNASPWLLRSNRESVRDRGSRAMLQRIVQELGEADLRGGGVALLLHPVRKERKRLSVFVEDANGRRIKLPDAVFPATLEWSAFALALPVTDPKDFDAQRCARLVVQDADEAVSTDFLVGKVTVVGRRPPLTADLDLEVRPLLPGNERELAILLQTVTRSRGLAHWHLDFQPRSLRMLVGVPIFDDKWHTLLRRGLEGIFDGTPPNSTVEKLVLQDLWLNERFIIPKALLSPEQHHIAVVGTAGGEFPIGLDVDRAVQNFYHKLITEAVTSGMLPVVVLGPDKAGPGFVPQCQELWRRLASELPEQHPGVPIIDLRSVTLRERSGQLIYANGQLQRCADLWAGACTELVLRIERMQRIARDAKR